MLSSLSKFIPQKNTKQPQPPPTPPPTPLFSELQDNVIRTTTNIPGTFFGDNLVSFWLNPFFGIFNNVIANLDCLDLIPNGPIPFPGQDMQVLFWYPEERRRPVLLYIPFSYATYRFPYLFPDLETEIHHYLI